LRKGGEALDGDVRFHISTFMEIRKESRGSVIELDDPRAMPESPLGIEPV